MHRSNCWFCHEAAIIYFLPFNSLPSLCFFITVMILITRTDRSGRRPRSEQSSSSHYVCNFQKYNYDKPCCSNLWITTVVYFGSLNFSGFYFIIILAGPKIMRQTKVPYKFCLIPLVDSVQHIRRVSDNSRILFISSS